MIEGSLLLESDIAWSIIPFLGLKDSLRLYSTLSKQCYKRLQEYLIQPKRGVIDSAQFVYIGDGLRTTANLLNLVQLSEKAESILRVDPLDDYCANQQVLRDLHLLEDLVRLNNAVYTYWNSTPTTPFKGVFQLFLSILESEQLITAMDKDAQYWNSSRVNDEFIVIFDRPDGTIFVSEDCQRVYLVQSNDKSLGECANMEYRNDRFIRKPNYRPPLMHTLLPGAIVETTLLNWQGVILSDGFIMPTAMATPQRRKDALRAYVRAVDSGTLITTLPTKEGTLKVIPEPVIDADEVRRLKRVLFAQLESIRNTAYYTGQRCHSKVVFRCQGLTDEEYSPHTISIFGMDLDEPIFFNTSSLTEEYVQTLQHVSTTIGGKPHQLFVEEINLVGILSAVLEDTGVGAFYYVKPCKEEESLNLELNPDTCNSCAVCDKYRQSDGTKLLRCGRCRKIKYCCKAHQKEHWKTHKHECSEA